MKEFCYDDIKGILYDQYGTPVYSVKGHEVINIKPDQITHAYASGIGDMWFYCAEDCDYYIQVKQYNRRFPVSPNADYFYEDENGRVIYLKVEG